MMMMMVFNEILYEITGTLNAYVMPVFPFPSKFLFRFLFVKFYFLLKRTLSLDLAHCLYTAHNDPIQCSFSLVNRMQFENCRFAFFFIIAQNVFNF